MTKIWGIELRQFFRKPIWTVIFALAILASIVLPRSSITDLTVVPGMVYFIMVMSLILFIYGAETARMEVSQHIDENISTMPFYKRYVWCKLLYWLSLCLIIYIIFYAAVLSYIGIVHHAIHKDNITESLLYTLLCWLLPFYYSIILGNVIYRWIPGIYSYLIIVFVWFLTMPYNSMLGFIPREWSAWIINGDPNIIEIFSTNPLESLEINKGYFMQRLFMTLILASLYLLSSYKRNLKVRTVALSVVACSLFIPFLSPFVPYITGGDSLGTATVRLPFDQDLLQSDLHVTKYSFRIKHGESNHDLNYDMDMEIESPQDRIHLVLLSDFEILSLKMNNSSVYFQRNGNLIEIQLPERRGILHWKIRTSTFIAVGPNTAQLIATMPWYPMVPKEAQNPYKYGAKEKYDIYWRSPVNPILSNLQQNDNGHWTGTAYGPTILMGKFEHSNNIVYPRYESSERANRIYQGLTTIFKANNKKYKASEKLPNRIYYVTTFYGMQANPDEAYIYPDVYPVEDILKLFYPKAGVGK